MHSVEIVDVKIKRQPISIVLQIIFSFGVLVAGIVSLLFHEWLPLFYGMLTLALGVAAWNNFKLAKRKVVAIIYLIFALITLVSMIWELVW